MRAMVPLTGNTGRDDDNVSTGQGKLQSIVLGEVAGDFLVIVSAALTGDALGRGTRTATEEMWERSAATPGVLTTS